MLFLAGSLSFAESGYITAYGKAEAEYSAWLANNARDGKTPSSEERRAMHAQLFAEAQRAYVKEVHEFQTKTMQTGNQMTRGLKNYGTSPSATGVAQASASSATLPQALPASPQEVSSGSAEVVSFKGLAPPTAGASVKTLPPASAQH